MIERISSDPASAIVSDAIEYVNQRPSQEIHIALTGGRAGQIITAGLLAALGDNPCVHFWWSDERFVDSQSADRTAKGIDALDLKCHVHISQDPHEADDANASALVYAATLHKYTTTRFCSDNSMMDICILSVGPDGHIASLFPGHQALDSSAAVIAVADSPKPPAERVTWTYPTINASREIWLVATGEEKRQAVSSLRNGVDFHDCPAAGAHGKLATVLYTDLA